MYFWLQVKPSYDSNSLAKVHTGNKFQILLKYFLAVLKASFIQSKIKKKGR